MNAIEGREHEAKAAKVALLGAASGLGFFMPVSFICLGFARR
jgi:hypothetical protein